MDFYNWARPWRERFGIWHGLKIAMVMRKALWSLPANSEVVVKVPGISKPITLRAGTSDPEVFMQIFKELQADFPIFGEPRVIVDAGANIGLASVVFAHRFPRAEILALEIDRQNFELLRRNTADYPNVKAVLKGLWSKKTDIFVTNPGAESWAFQVSEQSVSDGRSISALGVKDILDEYSYARIDLLKIDIEGSEYEVFKDGVDDWIDRVGMLAIEVHDRFRPGCTEAIRRALQPYGFIESNWAEYLLFTRDYLPASARNG